MLNGENKMFPAQTALMPSQQQEGNGVIQGGYGETHSFVSNRA